MTLLVEDIQEHKLFVIRFPKDVLEVNIVLLKNNVMTLQVHQVNQVVMPYYLVFVGL